jgi:hypothetical protein
MSPGEEVIQADTLGLIEEKVEESFDEKVEAMMEKVFEEWRCIECGRVERDPAALMEKDEDGDLWRCIECGRVTKDPKILTEKIGEVWKCIQCGKLAEDSKAKWRLRRHVETHLVDVSHSCSACGHTSTTSGALAQHMSKKHPEMKVQVRSSKPKSGKNGVDGFSEPRVETSIEEADEKAEALIARVGEMLYCGECGKSMPKEKKWAMRRHVEVHLVGMSFPCDICGKFSKSTHGLYQHKSKQHPELKIIRHLSAEFKCNICGKGSKTSKGLSNHKWKYHKGMEMKLETNIGLTQAHATEHPGMYQ